MSSLSLVFNLGKYFFLFILLEVFRFLKYMAFLTFGKILVNLSSNIALAHSHFVFSFRDPQNTHIWPSHCILFSLNLSSIFSIILSVLYSKHFLLSYFPVHQLSLNLKGLNFVYSIFQHYDFHSSFNSFQFFSKDKKCSILSFISLNTVNIAFAISFPFLSFTFFLPVKTSFLELAILKYW